MGSKPVLGTLFQTVLKTIPKRVVLDTFRDDHGGGYFRGVMVATGWGQDLEGRDRDLGRSDAPIRAFERGIGTLDAQVLGSNPLNI